MENSRGLFAHRAHTAADAALARTGQFATLPKMQTNSILERTYYHAVYSYDYILWAAR